MYVLYQKARLGFVQQQGVICYHKLFDSLERGIDAALSLSAKGSVMGFQRLVFNVFRREFDVLTTCKGMHDTHLLTTGASIDKTIQTRLTVGIPLFQ